jgi:hypothetical protein
MVCAKAWDLLWGIVGTFLRKVSSIPSKICGVACGKMRLKGFATNNTITSRLLPPNLPTTLPNHNKKHCFHREKDLAENIFQINLTLVDIKISFYTGSEVSLLFEVNSAANERLDFSKKQPWL